MLFETGPAILPHYIYICRICRRCLLIAPTRRKILVCSFSNWLTAGV